MLIFETYATKYDLLPFLAVAMAAVLAAHLHRARCYDDPIRRQLRKTSIWIQISVRVDIKSATETIYKGYIPGRVKSKTNLAFTASLLDVQQ